MSLLRISYLTTCVVAFLGSGCRTTERQSQSASADPLEGNELHFKLDGMYTYADANQSFDGSLDPAKALGCDAFGGRLPTETELEPILKKYFFNEHGIYWTADDPTGLGQKSHLRVALKVSKELSYTGYNWTVTRIKPLPTSSKLKVICLREVPLEVVKDRVVGASPVFAKDSDPRPVALPEAMTWSDAAAPYDGFLSTPRKMGCAAYGMRLPTFKELAELKSDAAVRALGNKNYNLSPQIYWTQDIVDSDPSKAYGISVLKYGFPVRKDKTETDDAYLKRARPAFPKTKNLNVVCFRK